MAPLIIEIKPLKLRYNKGSGTQTPGNGARLTTLIRRQQKRELLKRRLEKVEEDLEHREQ